jgi:hypothetical protein
MKLAVEKVKIIVLKMKDENLHLREKLFVDHKDTRNGILKASRVQKYNLFVAPTC